MIKASKAFINKLNAGANQVNYATVTLKDGTRLNLEPKDFMTGGCTISDNTAGGSEFSVGNAVSKVATLQIANHDDRFSRYDFYSAAIDLSVAIKSDGGTVEKVKKGTYHVSEPETPGDTISLTTIDSMIYFDKSYNDSKTSYPASLQTILTDACFECGIKIGFGQFDNYNYVAKDKPKDVTYRQVVSYVAQIAGYNARMDNDDRLGLVWYDTAILDIDLFDGGYFDNDTPHYSGDALDGGNFTNYASGVNADGGSFNDAYFNISQTNNLTVATDDVVITGVKIISDDKEYIFGSDGYVMEINNPFTSGREQEVVNYLGGRMVGMRFRPFSGDILCNPLCEPYDVGFITDRKGNTYKTILNSVEYTIGSYTNISCQAESPLRKMSKYYSDAAKAVVTARRETQKQLSDYDLSVQHLNKIAGNAMGYYTTNDVLSDGSKITYMHDKPQISDSKVVYKQSIDGFFLSRDGGKTYTLGRDSQGNAVYNILAAIGIVCDWIKGGTLTLGGDNNTEGVCTVYDAAKVLVARLDRAGVFANRGTIGGWSIGNDFLEASNAIIRSFADADKSTRATMNDASFKVWVNEVEKCYMGRGGYNGFGTPDSGLMLIHGRNGIELDSSTGNIKAGGDIESSKNIVASQNLRCGNTFSCDKNANFYGPVNFNDNVWFKNTWSGQINLNGVTIIVKNGLITNAY